MPWGRRPFRVGSQDPGRGERGKDARPHDTDGRKVDAGHNPNDGFDPAPESVTEKDIERGDI